jgi:hypothetical protein
MAITTSDNDIKERLSVAYLTAVAARAGCQITEFAIDKESVDAIIRPVQGSSHQIDLQLKATSAKTPEGEHVKFDLPIKNYDTLRRADHINPHYLVLVLLHEDSSRWLSISPSELAICGTAIYGDFCGLPSVPNTATRTVTLPQNQRFNVEVLRQMIEVAPRRIGAAGG